MTSLYTIKKKITYETGINSEKYAGEFLKKQGWSILHQRYRCPAREIDLIAKKTDWLLFIEVKHRKSIKDALFALTDRQKTRLFNAASYYLDTQYLLNPLNIRFDLIALDQHNTLEHIKDIVNY